MDGVGGEPQPGEEQLVGGPELSRHRDQLERRATTLFVGFLVAMAAVCGAIIVSGWFAGVLDDPPERVFWAGAMLAGLTVGVFAVAAFPGGPDDVREVPRLRRTIRLGLVLALLSPALCIGALVVDFYV